MQYASSLLASPRRFGGLLARTLLEKSETQGRAYGSAQSAETKPRLTLSAGACMVPHPDKADRGGEDSYFIADNQRALGVADGVGGWAEVGIDAGLYARQIMDFAKVESELVADNSASASPEAEHVLSAQHIFEVAFSKMDAIGSSTSCILVLNGSTLLSSNLGDSAFMVLRNGKVVVRSDPQQHRFNHPFQVGSIAAQSDTPAASQQLEVPLQVGDILVVATDGVWDNCFDEDILKMVRHASKHKLTPQKAAELLAQYARHRSLDSRAPSPFAFQAAKAGIPFHGGKMDDVTVVFAYVNEVQSAA